MRGGFQIQIVYDTKLVPARNPEELLQGYQITAPRSCSKGYAEVLLRRVGCAKSEATQECFEELASVGFTHVTNHLRDALKTWCSTFQNTKVVEDMFQRVRKAEIEQGNESFGGVQVWSTPTQKKVLSTVHEHRELDISDRPLVLLPRNQLNALTTSSETTNLFRHMRFGFHSEGVAPTLWLSVGRR